MFRFHWLTSLRNKLRADSTRRIQSQRKYSRLQSFRAATAFVSRTAAERLEDRTLLTAFTVVNTNDSGTGSLREAIEQANANADADTITFDAALAGQTIVLETEIRISNDLTIIGLGADVLTLDGNGDSRIFNIYSANNGITADIEISGLTLTNGYANSGGAIQNRENLTLEDMIITDNEADVQGGGLHNSSSGILKVTNSQITENRALRGGGIYSQYSMLIISSSTISKNESTKDGGGIHYTHSDRYDNSPSIIIDTTFSENSAVTYGGGIFNSRGNLQITNSTLSRNAAVLGGGIYTIGNADGGIVSVTDSTFSENAQVEAGGGIYSNNTMLTIDGSTFSDNAAIGIDRTGIAGIFTGNGGGIFNVGGTLTVIDTDYTRNSAVSSGGGIYNRLSDAFLVSRSTFFQNSAQTGAGIYNHSNAMNVTESSFLENEAVTFHGAGIYHSVEPNVEELVEVVISDSQFSKNTAHFTGAGIYMLRGLMTITDSTLSENNGGGVYNSSGTLTVNATTFNNNEASSSGGGIANGGTLSVLDSTFEKNISRFKGGAIYNTSSGTARIINSTISGNRSSGQGGGLYSSSELPLTVLNSTITGNIASNTGGGIYSSNVTPTVTNSIVAGNTANNSAQIYGSFTNHLSIIQNSIEGLIDPILRDNGGPTKTHALVPGSTAINSGDNSAVSNAEIDTDQRGSTFHRIVGGAVDLGAYEVQVFHSQIDLKVVNSKTSTLSNGESNSLPDNLGWINEWSGYWLEIWISTPSTTDLGIQSVTLNLSYNTAITTATNIEYGFAFTSNQTGTINDVTGTIDNLSAETNLTDIGDDQHVLFARIRFEPTSDETIDLNLQEQSLNPQKPEFLIGQSEILFAGGSPSEEVHGLSPQTLIYANPYDLNDDDAINFRDLMLFASVYNTIPSESHSDYSWFADLNQSDRVNFKDLILFASNYGKRKLDHPTIVYPQNFPHAWNNQLLVDTTQGEPQLAPETLSQSTADIVLDSVVEHVSPQLSPSQNETLENIDIQVIDLQGDALGRAVSSTIYIDADAAGYGWFVDTTPGDNSEFQVKSQLSLIALPDTDAAGRVDLWSVIMHELGHLLGYEHEDTGLMQDTLPPGVRRLPSWELDIDLGNNSLPEEADSFFLTIQDETELVPF